MKLKKEDVVVVNGFCNALLCTDTVDPFSTTKSGVIRSLGQLSTSAQNTESCYIQWRTRL